MADKWFERISQRGFTLIEVLFSLSICLLIILNSVPILRIVTAKDKLSLIFLVMLLELNKFHQFCIRLRILKSMMI